MEKTFGSRVADINIDRQKLGVAERMMVRFTSIGKHTNEMGFDLNKMLVTRPAATFLMRAGTSFAAGTVKKGDLLVVDRSLVPQMGSLVVVINAEGLGLVIWKGGGGDLVDGDEGGILVWGVVRWVIRQIGH